MGLCYLLPTSKRICLTGKQWVCKCASHLVVYNSWDTMDCGPLGSSIYGIFQARILPGMPHPCLAALHGSVYSLLHSLGPVHPSPSPTRVVGDLLLPKAVDTVLCSWIWHRLLLLFVQNSFLLWFQWLCPFIFLGGFLDSSSKGFPLPHMTLKWCWFCFFVLASPFFPSL